MSADVKIGGDTVVQMAVRPDQGRGPDHQPAGKSEHHAARRAAPHLPRPTTITAWRAPRRASRSRPRRQGLQAEPSPAEPADKQGAARTSHGRRRSAARSRRSMPLQLPKANAKKVEGRATQDLTAHPWAGLKVARHADRPRPGGPDRRERAFRVRAARAPVHQAAGARRRRAAQETGARARHRSITSRARSTR